MRNDITETEVKKYNIKWIHTNGECNTIYEGVSKEIARMWFYCNFASDFEIIKIDEIK